MTKRNVITPKSNFLVVIILRIAHTQKIKDHNIRYIKYALLLKLWVKYRRYIKTSIHIAIAIVCPFVSKEYI